MAKTVYTLYGSEDGVFSASGNIERALKSAEDYVTASGNTLDDATVWFMGANVKYQRSIARSKLKNDWACTISFAEMSVEIQKFAD